MAEFLTGPLRSEGPFHSGGPLVLKEPYARFIVIALVFLSLGVGLSVVAKKPYRAEFHRSEHLVVSAGEAFSISPPEGAFRLLYIERSAVFFSSNVSVRLNVTVGREASLLLEVPAGEEASVDLNSSIRDLFVILIRAEGSGTACISYDYVVVGYEYPLSWLALPAAVLATSGVGLLFIGLLEKMVIARAEEHRRPASGNL